MFRKLAILTALLVAGALLSSVFAELATGKPAPIQAAEECAKTLTDGSDSLFSEFDGDNASGMASQPSFTGHFPATATAQRSEAVQRLAEKQPLFLLHHALLFYDHI